MAEPWLSEFVPWIAGVEYTPSATADGTEWLSRGLVNLCRVLRELSPGHPLPLIVLNS
jgi:hypothetical protein